MEQLASDLKHHQLVHSDLVLKLTRLIYDASRVTSEYVGCSRNYARYDG